MLRNSHFRNDWKTLGQVVASAWVSVYDISDRVIINQFEPDYWSFVDEECPANNTDKNNFYKQKIWGITNDTRGSVN